MIARSDTSTRLIIGSTLFVLTLLALMVTALGHGQVRIATDEIVRALVSSGSDPMIVQIVREIRLPRICVALIAGGALGVAGVLMQALFRNPMADAWSLGLTAGGQLGVALTLAAAGFIGPTAISFVTVFEGISMTAGAACGVAGAALAMAALARRVNSITLLVVGLMLGFTAQGFVSVLLHFANRVGGRAFSGWNDGTFAGVTSADLPMLFVPVIFGLLLAISNAKPLTALLLGETYAASLGADVARLRRMALIATVLLVAPVTAYCGPVTFIGLIVPHFARAIVGSARILPLLPLSALAGAALALAADFIVHLPWQQHFLHLNAVLAMVGAPVVILLLIFSRTLRGQR